MLPIILYTYWDSLLESAEATAAATLPTHLRISEQRASYRARATTPSEMLRALLARIDTCGRDEVWISRAPADALMAQALALDALLARSGCDLLDRYPLFGIPFAVKDNIDVAGLTTTAACPEFAYVPERSASAVERLLQGHALCLGKTNLDQFATGLVGTRSPYGAVRNALDPSYVSGGSSSGSAVAVALGLAAFALGTDTAGSGRVPAGLNGIIGLKPTRGLVSTRGTVPACRSLDCVSVFALDIDDAWTVLGELAGPDPRDEWSRQVAPLPPKAGTVKLGLPASPEFFGDAHSTAAWGLACSRLEGAPQIAMELCDFAPLHAAASLLYGGPWIAERRAALGDFFITHGDAIDPIVRDAIAQAGQHTAVDAFEGQYRLARARAEAQALFERVDALLVPTAAIFPTIAAVQAEPVRLNTELGHYTNFVNLLDLAALAIPATTRDGLPFGVTLIGPAGSDHRLLAIAAKLALAFGYGTTAQVERLAASPLPFREPTLQIAVVGAHLAGQPLNWQLIETGARLLATTHTAGAYRLHALATTPPKPGLVKVAKGGAAIEVEVWEIPERNFGALMRQVGAPLGIGTLELADGRSVKGFICEPWAVAGAPDISHHGGWRAYLAASRQPVQENAA
jgi:allophanate hydrolase